jgi:hypothetical protein
MYPNQPQQTPSPMPPSPGDYLNQIAPQTPKKPLFRLSGLRLILAVIAGLVVVVSIFALVINAVSASRRHPLEQLSARLTATESIVADAQDNLKSSELRSLNRSLKIFLTNTNRDIAEPLLDSGVNVKKLDKDTVAKESGEDITSRLEDARLNAVYDRTYAREMAYQLETIITLMKQIYRSGGSDSLKSFLVTAYGNLEPTQQSFADFNAANG